MIPLNGRYQEVDYYHIEKISHLKKISMAEYLRTLVIEDRKKYELLQVDRQSNMDNGKK